MLRSRLAVVCFCYAQSLLMACGSVPADAMRSSMTCPSPDPYGGLGLPSGVFSGAVEAGYPPFGRIIVDFDGHGGYVVYLQQLSLLGQLRTDPFVLFSRGRVERGSDGGLMLRDLEREGLKGVFEPIRAEQATDGRAMTLRVSWLFEGYFPIDDQVRIRRL